MDYTSASVVQKCFIYKLYKGKIRLDTKCKFLENKDFKHFRDRFQMDSIPTILLGIKINYNDCK